MSGESIQRVEQKVKIAQLYKSISGWNSFFKANMSDSDIIAEGIHEAVRELDKIWENLGRMGVKGYVSGKGAWTEIVELDDPSDKDEITMAIPHSDTYAVLRHGDIMMKEATSNGFGIDYSEDEGTVISHMFIGDQININAPLGYLAYAPCINIQIGTLKFIPKEDVDASLAPLHNTLGKPAKFSLDMGRFSTFKFPQT